MIRSLRKAFTVAALSFASVTILSAPASAAGQNGLVENGEFVFWYNSNCPNGVGVSDFLRDKPDLAGYTFLGGSKWPGVGQAVKNNAACGRNLYYTGARVYFNSGYKGVSDFIPRGSQMNLTQVKNENASWRWAEGMAH